MSWLKRWTTWRRVGCVLVVVSGFALFALGAANAFDYYRFHRAWNIGDRFSADVFRQMANTCAEIEIPGVSQHHFRADGLPSVFQRLNPLSTFFHPGTSRLLLYEFGRADVVLRIDTTQGDHHVFLAGEVGGRARKKTLWRKNPAAAEYLAPSGRLLTISEWRRQDVFQWIVLPNEIRVVTRGRFDRRRDAVAAIAVLSGPQREAIVAAIRAIPSPLFGREHTSGATDGIRLSISFNADDRRGPDDIMLSNTWREGITPLVDAVSRCLPAEHRIRFREKISGYRPEDDIAWTWREVDAMEHNWIMWWPWWCLWQRFVDFR